MTTFDHLNYYHFFRQRQVPQPIHTSAFGWSIVMSFGLKLSSVENKGELVSIHFSYLQRRLNNGEWSTQSTWPFVQCKNECLLYRAREKRVGYAVEQGQIDFQDRSSASLACYYYYSRLGSTCQKVVTHAIASVAQLKEPSPGFCFLQNQRQISSNNTRRKYSLTR